MNTKRYTHHKIDDNELERAKKFLYGKKWTNTKKVAEALSISRCRATAIIYRLGGTRWASNHPNGTTFSLAEVE